MSYMYFSPRQSEEKLYSSKYYAEKLLGYGYYRGGYDILASNWLNACANQAEDEPLYYHDDDEGRYVRVYQNGDFYMKSLLNMLDHNRIQVGADIKSKVHCHLSDGRNALYTLFYSPEKDSRLKKNKKEEHS